MLRSAAVALAATVFLAFGAAADPAQPGQGQEATGQTAAPQKPDPDERICKTTNKTGSRVNKEKICMTRAEWDRVSQESNRAISEQQARSKPPGSL